MNLLVTILLAVLIFGVIIIIHELGHFLTAKAAGVAVPEFSIGMGPKLFQIKHKETNYTLRLLPIGGYVAMEGEDEESDDERAFCNKKPWQRLIIMAAGMGSRYGGLKQIDPVDKEGHIIMDFSIYDAVQAGFQKVVFIIKKENEADFRSAIGDRLSNQLEVSYVFQDLHNIPEGYEVPEGRVKPWGTGHAVLSCINEIDGPFVVINADDYYGSHAFKMAYDFLTENEDTADTYRYMMVGYKLENTLTENGHVARGVCVTDEEGHLLKINERTHIEKHDGGTAYTEDDGKTWTMLPEGSTVSMNMWGFSASILKELKDRFPKFLDENLKVNPLKCEYFLPFVVDELLGEKRATVKVLKSMDKWYGVTYKEDKPVVVAAIQNLKDGGLYPQRLWEE